VCRELRIIEEANDRNVKVENTEGLGQASQVLPFRTRAGTI